MCTMNPDISSSCNYSRQPRYHYALFKMLHCGLITEDVTKLLYCSMLFAIYQCYLPMFLYISSPNYYVECHTTNDFVHFRLFYIFTWTDLEQTFKIIRDMNLHNFFLWITWVEIISTDSVSKTIGLPITCSITNHKATPWVKLGDEYPMLHVLYLATTAKVSHQTFDTVYGSKSVYHLAYN